MTLLEALWTALAWAAFLAVVVLVAWSLRRDPDKRPVFPPDHGRGPVPGPSDHSWTIGFEPDYRLDWDEDEQAMRMVEVPDADGWPSAPGGAPSTPPADGDYGVHYHRGSDKPCASPHAP